MATPFEAPFSDRDAARQIVVEFLEGTSSRYGYYKLLASFLEDTRETKQPKVDEVPKPPKKHDFKAEVELGGNRVNAILSELGGLPVRFISQDTGDTSGSILGCKNFDTEKGKWEFDMHLRSANKVPQHAIVKPIIQVEFEPGELKQSYYDAIAPSPSKAA